MAGKPDDERPGFSRRELLKRAGLVGVAAAAVPAEALVPTAAAAAVGGELSAVQVAAPQREALETLSAVEAETLEAIVARLIPTDESGPGAAEAHAARYIDRALGGALASSREEYRSGLGAIDSYARASKGAPFARLPANDQDAVLNDVEKNVAKGFTPNAATFFGTVRRHTIEGTFCDPFYGGNANFVGWDLIGYPGLRVAVAASDQRMDSRPAPTHKSAYDLTMFTKKKPVKASVEEGTPDHGD